MKRLRTFPGSFAGLASRKSVFGHVLRFVEDPAGEILSNAAGAARAAAEHVAAAGQRMLPRWQIKGTPWRVPRLKRVHNDDHPPHMRMHKAPKVIRSYPRRRRFMPGWRYWYRGPSYYYRGRRRIRL